ncbi:hypothetical protein EV421DRAFT_1743785 [Armillaria borealis]|uniref:Uncharacterized protein n=1 Tax=Armillaria borealis TaxID=47425 RepID=A0AA39MEM8_9AGAR|nr:hypothetical protein EV421DRAFT_1743785 [Armillaria borealis]
MTILSCRDVHQEGPNSTSIGGYPSYFPTQLIPSQALAPSSTSTLSQTQAQEPVSLSSSETDGMHGDSFLAGSPPSVISNGLKEWVSNFLSEQLQCKAPTTQNTMSSSMATACTSTRDTSRVQVIQLTDPLEEYTLSILSSFHQFHSQKNYSPSSSTMTFQLLSQSPGMADQLPAPSNATTSPVPLILNQSSTSYHLTAPTTINPVPPSHNQNDIPD